MSAPTVHAAYVLAQAGQRGGMMHLSSQRDTGALNPVCGANPVRSKEIRTWAQAPSDLSALCADCAAHLTAHPYIDTVEDGLAVYLGSSAVAPTVRLVEVPPATIHVDESAHRDVDSGTDAFAALVASIEQDGVLQPVTVRRAGSGLVLVSGRRRLAAAMFAGLETVPTLVREIDDVQAVVEAISENAHRADVDPIAKATAYQRALAVLGGTIQDLADRVHLSRSSVSNDLRLLDLPTDLQDLVASGALSAAHGRALLRLPEGSPEQAALAREILDEGMSSHAAEHAARAAATGPAPAKLGDVSKVLAAALERAGLQGVKARVTTSADHARVVLDVAPSDLARVLEHLETLGATR